MIVFAPQFGHRAFWSLARLLAMSVMMCPFSQACITSYHSRSSLLPKGESAKGTSDRFGARPASLCPAVYSGHYRFFSHLSIVRSHAAPASSSSPSAPTAPAPFTLHSSARLPPNRRTDPAGGRQQGGGA